MKFEVGLTYSFEQTKEGYLIFPTIFTSKLIRVNNKKDGELLFESGHFIRFIEIEKGHWKIKEIEKPNEVILKVGKEE